MPTCRHSLPRSSIRPGLLEIQTSTGTYLLSGTGAKRRYTFLSGHEFLQRNE